MTEKEKQFERIYKETKNFGRVEFVKEIQMQINENRKLTEKIEEQKEVIYETINFLKKWGEEPDADMYIQMKEYKEFNELLKILNEVKK